MPKSSYLLIDLRGYTRFIANEPAKSVLAMMDRYYKIIEQAASDLRGIFCSTLGDTTGSWFTGHQHSVRAVKTAANVLETLRKDHFPLNAAAGIDSGQISRQNIKTPNMQVILPVGRPVAVAYHLEDLATIYNSDIIISGDTYNLLTGEFRKLFRLLGNRFLKGIDKKFIIYGARIA